MLHAIGTERAVVLQRLGSFDDSSVAHTTAKTMEPVKTDGGKLTARTYGARHRHQPESWREALAHFQK
jgi:hypothetical protein